MTYNLLNLPSRVETEGEQYLEIQYLSDGTKIAALGYEDMGYKYAGPFRYSVEYGDSMLESCVSAGGRIHCLRYDNDLDRYVTSMDARYYVPDHLGSTRAVIDGTGAVLWRADYLPYGRCVGVAGSSAAPAKEYMWTGKEKQAMSILSGDWYDSIARYLGTQGQFMSIDPLSEKYPGISPYAYCAGDPVNAVDPEGTDEWNINKNGEIVEHIENTEHDAFCLVDDDGTRMTTVNGDGEIVYRSVEFEYGTVSGFCRASGIINDFTGFVMKSEAAAADLFKFMSDNVGVEMGLVVSNKESLVLTDHNPKQIRVSQIARSFGRQRNVSIDKIVHSHPLSSNPSDQDGRGDIPNADKTPYGACLYVYQPGFNNLVKYNKNGINKNCSWRKVFPVSAAKGY